MLNDGGSDFVFYGLGEAFFAELLAAVHSTEEGYAAFAYGAFDGSWHDCSVLVVEANTYKQFTPFSPEEMDALAAKPEKRADIMEVTYDEERWRLLRGYRHKTLPIMEA